MSVAVIFYLQHKNLSDKKFLYAAELVVIPQFYIKSKKVGHFIGHY